MTWNHWNDYLCDYWYLNPYHEEFYESNRFTPNKEHIRTRVTVYSGANLNNHYVVLGM